MWIVEPTVIIGRHQLLDTEVNTDYCRANGIDIVRRKSGGGCVYSDLRNVMMSYITASGADTAATFCRLHGQGGGPAQVARPRRRGREPQ